MHDHLRKPSTTRRTGRFPLFFLALRAVLSHEKVRRLPAVVTLGVLCLSGCTGSRKELGVGNTTEQEQAIATLREAYAAFNRGDMDAAVAGLDPQIEWTEPVEFPGGGAYHGRDGVKRYLTQSRAAWAEVSSQPEQFIPAGDRIVVLVHARVRPKGSNDWQDVKLADVYTITACHLGRGHLGSLAL
jgi:uncharacterized protein